MGPAAVVILGERHEDGMEVALGRPTFQGEIYS
jgi:hypothetical protein